MRTVASLYTVRLVFLQFMKGYFIFIITAMNGTMTSLCTHKAFL